MANSPYCVTCILPTKDKKLRCAFYTFADSKEAAFKKAISRVPDWILNAVAVETINLNTGLRGR